MASALVTTNRQYLYNSFQDGLQFTLNEAFAKDNHYTLFKYEDWPAWVIFTSVFIVLITFDNVVLNRNPNALTIASAIAYTCFWVCCAFAFCGWVYWYYGANQAFMWMSGYMLEWMLSFDNLFVFHMIFQVYGTPDHLKHRPLYLGICGAIVFRLAFIFIGEYLMHAMFFMHLIFGAFLVYTGFKTATADEDDEDPSQHPLVQWLQRQVPFVSAYDDQGRFFVRVPLNEHGEPILPEASSARPTAAAAGESDPIARAEGGERQESSGYGAVDFSSSFQAPNALRSRTQVRATMLFLVVCCLEISDLLFAVDSVSAIVAQVNDLFLAYTSAVFAMLGLRATFFIIDMLAKLFSLLKYGVSAVLVFIGFKLILSKMYHIPPGIVCAVLVGSIGLSMMASVAQDRWEKRAAEAAVLAKKGTPLPSPLLKRLTPRTTPQPSPLIKPRGV